MKFQEFSSFHKRNMDHILEIGAMTIHLLMRQHQSIYVIDEASYREDRKSIRDGKGYCCDKPANKCDSYSYKPARGFKGHRSCL